MNQKNHKLKEGFCNVIKYYSNLNFFALESSKVDKEEEIFSDHTLKVHYTYNDKLNVDLGFSEPIDSFANNGTSIVQGSSSNLQNLVIALGLIIYPGEVDFFALL